MDMSVLIRLVSLWRNVTQLNLFKIELATSTSEIKESLARIEGFLEGWKFSK